MELWGVVENREMKLIWLELSSSSEDSPDLENYGFQQREVYIQKISIYPSKKIIIDWIEAYELSWMIKYDDLKTIETVNLILWCF